jgi:K+-transporting ATPase ATPase C chain
VIKDGKVVGSSLLAQKFQAPEYFWERPSAVDYNPMPSGGSNFGPTSADLKAKIAERQKQGLSGDMLYSSASGLDPHISPAAARSQVERIVVARKLGETGKQKLLELIDRHTEGRAFGFLGEVRINVLQLNLALDQGV